MVCCLFSSQLTSYSTLNQLAFGAALLNIQIPLILGELVNIVARYMREHTGNYLQEIRGPALKLLGLYGIQVSCTVPDILSLN